MAHEPLTAISSIDGRYRTLVEPLAKYFSEYALIHKRCVVECEYLIALSEDRKTGMRTFSAREKKMLRDIADISLAEARIVKAIEKEGYKGIPATNHDVKAVEYFLKSKTKGTSLEDISEWIHFALTSEDVNSVAYGFALRAAIEAVMLPALQEIEFGLDDCAKKYAGTPMLARTHGQPASPTTFGKEMRVFESRLSRQYDGLRKSIILVKFGGATGNWNAHVVASPSVDWPAFAKKFVSKLNENREIKLELNEVTTQIEPHDTYAELFDSMRRINTILIDFSQDMWRYISDGWIGQKVKKGEVGSSTMPHKVNPIDFENAEGNFGIANALFEHFSRKLPISRLQRDLSDSTVERAFGSAFAHSLIGYKSLVRGLGKIAINKEVMLEALQSHPEVIAEAFQTVLRREGVAVPYEKLKELTRDKQVTLADFAKFIDELPVNEKVKKRLKALRPETYIGRAAKIAAHQ
ncbi:adenylosuccinate lyase [Candidatus Kaiserbacteria bacterium RIFCSPLOWO2_01_FULL_53_17]|uniref:Adenylosuccinate lyase n=1 Tax=Candidatus Kaiserbacteria bacterium RIFCSPLOWO2_01_FULL_53_17 TaxID=1798511 RepID=A0A1F6EFT5_9BACT|nr:MAG: adenylosuccinate lyase [Candidatus Kaiserbacteria bacterium RIFCSPLOWO2_01_FULL_53_17]